jgi:putative component of toxin-antitoxin plasmid stabilization module
MASEYRIGARVRHIATGRVGEVVRVASNGLVVVLVAGYGYIVYPTEQWEVVS